MSVFVQSYPPLVGDLPFGTYLDAIATTPYSGCFMSSPSYPIKTISPNSRNNVTCQPMSNLAADISFFEEAIGNSSMPIKLGLGFPRTTSQFMAASQTFEGCEPPQRILPTVEGDEKPPRRPRNRRQSQASLSLSGPSVPRLIAESPKPKKRGRKPKSELKEPGKARRKERLDDEEFPKDPRRQHIHERNRIAAAKFRLQKRDKASALASLEQAMEDQNRYLSTYFDSLTAEIYHLKMQLLQHTDCNCVLIQKYIANEAKKSVDSLLSCSSAFQLDGDLTSPYQRGSSGSGSNLTELWNLPTPKMEGIPPTWTDPFQQGSKSSEVAKDMFDLPLEPFQKAGGSQPIASMSPLSGCEPGIFVSMGPQPQQANGMAWDSHWEFR
ncbi:hypothetical protein EDB80DRAFT_829314 [Ilyonectria destructans]|nr:hypothetical protein EDB80DRAFT_829314 [Ilyonectria destructans]